MNVGMTYDLRDDYLAAGYTEEQAGEFDSPRTINAIEQSLQALGHRTDRIGSVKRLVERLAAGDRWDIVFNIAEGMFGIGREAQVPAILDAYEIPYTFSDPLVLALTLDKGMTKHIVRAHGIPTPDFAVVAEPEDIDGVDMGFPLFAKPLAEGTGKGITGASKITSKAALREVCLRILRENRQPALVEAYCPGREFTVGVLGTGREAAIVAVLEIAYNKDSGVDIYSFHTKEHWEKYLSYALRDDPAARRAGELALQAYRVLGCRDAGRVDMRVDAAGVPNFLEVNPLAGLNPGHSDLPILCELAGVTYQQLISRIMASALKRCGLA